MPADDPIDDRPEPRDDDRPRRQHRDPDEPRGGDRHYDEDGYEITSDDSMWAVFAHVGVFVVGFLAPLIIMFVYADKSKFVVRHARESLNHQITLVLYTFLWMSVAALIGLAVGGASQSAASGLITAWVLFMIGAIALQIKNLIVLILAAVAASRYQQYRYPLSFRLIG